jgi:hypothetical protein
MSAELIEASRAVALAGLRNSNTSAGAWPGSYGRASSPSRSPLIICGKLHAHALPQVHGEEQIQAILDEAFADADFRPMRAEVA